MCAGCKPPLEKIQRMKQTVIGLDIRVKKTRKGEFLDQMNRLVPWYCIGRAHCPKLPAKPHWQATVFSGDHAAYPFDASVVYPV